MPANMGLHPEQEVFFCDKSGRNVRRLTVEQACQADRPEYTIAFSPFGGFRICAAPAIIRHDQPNDFVKVTTRRGKEAITTSNHVLFTRAHRRSRFGATKANESGYLTAVRAGDLKPGETIATLGFWVEPNHGVNPITEIRTAHLNVRLKPEIMELGGLWLGDGSRHGSKLRLSLGDKDHEIIERLEHLAEVSIDRDPRGNGHGINLTLQPDAFYAIMVELGFAGKHSSAYNKRVPDWVFGASNDLVAALLRGYFSTDGCFSGHSLSSCSANGKLTEDIVLLLSRFGIVPYMDWKYVPGGHLYHRILTVSKASELLRFAESIGFIQQYKNEALDAYLTRVGEKITARGNGKHKKRYSTCWDEVERITPYQSPVSHYYEVCVPNAENRLSGGILL